MATQYDATINQFVGGSQRLLDAVFRQSTQRVISIAQKPVAEGGNMPIDTGFLRASFVTSVGSMPSQRAAEGRTYAAAQAEVVATISRLRAGATFYGGWTADYAVHQEYGSRGRPPRAFLRKAIQQWQQIVTETVQRLAAMSATRGR